MGDFIKNGITKGIDKGKQLFGAKQESIVSAAFIMMVLLMVTKFIGFAKMNVFARIFGASTELDVFWAAFTVPDIIFNIIVLGSVNAALIPAFADALGTGRLKKIFSDVVRLFLVLFIVFSVVVFIFAPQLAQIVSKGGLGGFGYETGELTRQDVALMAQLMRIMLLSPILLGISSVLTSAIQVNKRFIVPALAPLAYNIGIIVGALVFSAWLNMGVVGLAYGVVLGSVLHLLVQIPLASSLGLSISWPGRLFSRDVMHVIKLALPRVLGLIGEQISIMVNTVISMGLGAGSLSAFRYGSSIYLLPVQLLGVTIAQAAMPTLALEYQAAGKQGEQPELLQREPGKRNFGPFAVIFSRSLNQILFLILPAVIFVVVLRLPIVRLVLGAGAFDWEDTVVTAWVLALFGLAIAMQSVSSLVVRAFFAMEDAVTPAIVSVASLVVNIAGSILFTNFFSHYYDWRPLVESLLNHTRSLSGDLLPEFGVWFTTRSTSPAAVGGLALSAGVALFAEVVVLMFILNRRMHVISWRNFWQPLLKKLLASLLMFVVMYTAYTWWNFKLDTSTVISIVLLFLVVGGIGVGVYGVISVVVDITEVMFFVKIVRRSVNRIRTVFSNGTSRGDGTDVPPHILQ